jgi:parallel beta-helix repeat protein
MIKVVKIILLLLFVALISFHFTSASTINLAKLNATTPINSTNDDLTAYINGSTSTGQINYTGYWYRNQSRYLPIMYHTPLNYEGRDFAYNMKKDFNGDLITTSYSDQAHIQKFNSSGYLLWNTTLDIDYDPVPLTIDSSNNIYVFGYDGDFDSLIIARLNSSGDNTLNITYPTEDFMSSIHGVELDSSRNIYFSYLNGTYSTVVVKLNSSGTHLWNSSFIADSEGYSNGDMELDNQNNTFIATKAYDSFLIFKYNSSGSLSWNVSYNVSRAGPVKLGALTTDQNGSVIISAGQSSGNNTIVKYNSTGFQLWNLSYGHISGKTDSIYSSILDSNNNLYVTGIAKYQPYTGVIGVDKINSTSGTLIWNSTVSLGDATNSAEGRGIALAENKIYVWAYVPGTYYGYGIENVSLLVLKENFAANGSSGNLILADTLDDANTQMNEIWSFCAYGVNQTGTRSSEACSNNLTIFNYMMSINSCQTLDIESTQYTLSQNVNSSATCFSISANNVTIDAAGFTINYSQSSLGYGINNTRGFNNTLIKNALIVEGSTTASAHAINSNGTNTTIQNNTIKTRGSNAYAVLLGSNNRNSTVLENIISTLNVEAIYLIAAQKSTIINNYINSTIIGIGITSGSLNNSILNNTIRTFGNTIAGIYVYSSANNTISNNSITTNGTSNYGLQIASGSSNNYFYQNTVNSTSASSIKIDDTETHDNTFESNVIIDNGQKQLEITATGLNGTILINQNILNYSFSGLSGKVIIENTTFGKIEFLAMINQSGSKLMGNDGSDIIFGNNSIFVNSSNNPGLNRSANVTLYGIGERGFIDPVIFKNGEVCSDCYNFTTLNASTVIFNVSSWSEFTIGDRPVVETTSSTGSGSSQTIEISHTFRPIETELREGYTKLMEEDSRAIFAIENESYMLNVKSVDQDKVNIEINNEEFFVSDGQEIQYHLTNSNNLFVKVNSIELIADYYRANITMQIRAILNSPEVQTGQNEENNVKKTNIPMMIAIILISVLGLWLIIKITYKKLNKNNFNHKWK